MVRASFNFQPHLNSTLVVGIAGASSAGKATLARKLVENLGEHAATICQNSYS